MKSEVSRDQFWDKLESFLLPCRLTGGLLKPCTFPFIYTSVTETASMRAVFHQTVKFFMLSLALVALIQALVIYGIAIYLIVHFYSYVHLHHNAWRLMKFVSLMVKRGFLEVVSEHGTLSMQAILVEHGLTLVGLYSLVFAFFLAIRWAWNRRAERLNREGNVPEVEAASVPGVWPPPPSSRS